MRRRVCVQEGGRAGAAASVRPFSRSTIAEHRAIHAPSQCSAAQRALTSSVAVELMPMDCCSQSLNLGMEESMLVKSSVALASTVQAEPRTQLDCASPVTSMG